MIHPDTELKFINPTVGFGVVATKFIPRGTITWVQDDLDRVFTPEEVSRVSPLMLKHLDTYCFTNSIGNKVLCWDHAKFINHSFKSTCMSTAYDFEIAICDIFPGQQLTDDYGYLNVDEPFFAVDEGTERKIVYPDDLLHFYREFDRTVQKNLDQIPLVDQPLQAYIREKTWAEFELVLRRQRPLRSLLTCYFDRQRLSA
jgi:uncharacterized protein